MQLQRDIYGFLLRYTRNRADADDLCQDTWLRIAVNLPKFRGGKFRAWVFTIATRIAHDWYRRRRREVSTEEEDLHGLVEAVAPHGAVTMEALPDSRAAWRALADLSEDEREAVVLKHVEGLTYEEISACLGSSVPALKMRVHRGLHKLCERL